MRKTLAYYVAAAMMVVPLPASSVNVETLTGDVKLACEALLCLAASSSGRPGECSQAIRRYLSITASRPDRQFTLRLNFLNLCPYASADATMTSFAQAVARGYGQCDAATLNKLLKSTRNVPDAGSIEFISSIMPSYCELMFSHQYVQAQAPKYVGLSDYGGYWVEAEDFAAAQAKYRQEYLAYCKRETASALYCVKRLDGLKD